ncbi:MAG: CBS domain-containing protein [Chloroflexota bacterium]|jgi:CBS domain-containing protein
MDLRSVLSTKSRQIISIGPDESLTDAMHKLKENNIGALVVIASGRQVAGILSERDIVRIAADDPDFAALRVDQVMTKDVVVGIPDDDVMHVAHVMTERRFRHLPVVNEKREIIGMVSIGDILKSQRDKFLGELDTLETQLLAED